ncbi:MAG: dihydroorotase [Alphaproteobacteria bacterium]|nr:dihydroorotase [Alphaproteobacteria bacterium]
MSALPLDLIVSGGTVWTPNGPERIDVGIRDGKIEALGDLTRAEAAERWDATGLTVLPGVIDSQVHFREPGMEHKEDLESGTRAAAMGGVTSIFEMPNTSPTTTTVEAMADKLARAKGRAWTDHAFFIGASEENLDQLGTLQQLPGCCGVKVFMGSSTGSLLVEDDDALRNLLSHTTRRVAVHAEHEPRLRERLHIAREEAHPRAHPIWRDVEAALKATQRITRLAREAGKRVHVLHITTGDEMAWLKDYKDVATVETTPQHLTLSAPDCYERLGTFAQMNPPIRDEAHRQALWTAIREGVVDVLGSDHAPHTREEKTANEYPATPSGMPGVQTIVPLMLDHVAQGNLTMERFVDLLCSGPQRIFNIEGKGRIALGYDGDLTIVDLKAKREITADWLQSKCGWSPFEGMTVQGWPVGTVIRGQTVMRDSELVARHIGEPVRFLENMEAR